MHNKKKWVIRTNQNTLLMLKVNRTNLESAYMYHKWRRCWMMCWCVVDRSVVFISMLFDEIYYVRFCPTRTRYLRIQLLDNWMPKVGRFVYLWNTEHFLPLDGLWKLATCEIKMRGYYTWCTTKLEWRKIIMEVHVCSVYVCMHVLCICLFEKRCLREACVTVCV